jgi:predicted nucleotidyltransferase component of viral defense system
MIHLGEIEKLSAKFGVSAEIIEKDYCINWLLVALSFLKEESGLVFYGGTAIKMVYFPVYRFSEDIDL